MPRCNICKTTDDLTASKLTANRHYKTKTYSYVYVQYRCRKCSRDKMRAYYATAKGKIAVRLTLDRSHKKHPERQRARSAVAYAVRKGTLTRPSRCSSCRQPELRIEGHHVDHYKPLEVTWLCKRCHAVADKSLLLLTK